MNVLETHKIVKKNEKPCHAPPSFLMDSITNPKVKTMEREGVVARPLVRNTSEVKGRVGALGWD